MCKERNLRTYAALLTAAMLVSVPVGAEESTNSPDLQYQFPVLDNQNQIDNPNQIDRPDELSTGHDSPHELSADQLSKELSNPNSPLASLTIKQTYTSFKGSLPGASNQSSNLTLFQPSFPFPLTEDGTTNLFIRPAFPYFWQQPVYDAQNNRFRNVSGFGDIGFDVAVGRSYDSGLVLVGGAQGTLPTGSSGLTADQWRLGPEFLVAKISKTHYWALFPSHQWDISGGDGSYSTSQLEIFGGFYLPNAWTIYTDSKWSYDWVSSQATIPLNLSVSKVTKLGNVPLKISLGVDYFVEQNELFGQDWAITLNITPIVPNFIYNAIHK